MQIPDLQKWNRPAEWLRITESIIIGLIFFFFKSIKSFVKKVGVQVIQI